MEVEAPKRSSSSRFQRVCVFCGSSSGKKPSYQLAAIQLGHELVERNIDLVYGQSKSSPARNCAGRNPDLLFFLKIRAQMQKPPPANHHAVHRRAEPVPRGRGIGSVYGGGSVGLMGLVSRAVYSGGRHVLGVVPRTIMPREIIGETVGEIKYVTGMHQRKAEMARQADAFIALPGGYGTLEELLEVITWAQLGIHDKPVGLLNVDGYYNSLLSFIDKAVDEGFIMPSARDIIVSAQTAHELLSKLEEYKAMENGSEHKLSWGMDQLQQTNGHAPNLEISR